LVGLNVDPVDTIFLGPGVPLQYEDLDAQPGFQPEQYYILALDDCGNTSIFLDPHITIYVDGAVSPCDRSLTIDWSPYQGWDNGIDFQEIWLTSDGLDTTIVVDSNTSSYTFEDLIEGEEYCFYIEAVENGTGIRSRSNVFCDLFEISAPLQDFVMTGVGFTDDGAAVQIDWQWDPNSDLSDYTILRYLKGYDVVQLIGPFDASSNLSMINTDYDQSVNPNIGPWKYSLEVQDACGGITDRGLYGQTIFLEGETLVNGGNELTWTPMELSNAEVLTYEVYKESVAGFSYLGATDAETLSFSDPFDPIFRNVSDIQYYVVGQASLLLPDGSSILVRSRSNTIAIDQKARISAPNVFAPDGVNNIFQPFVLHSENTQYQLQIFDRWGGQVFESRDLSMGWDGCCNGKSCPPGVYVYWIRLVQANGRVVNYEGDVLLLR
ncbi:MAG: gliding motility-associated C-terminal domain-containing protein, partial [Phaeodactylibacter sp.]|nr:gliding motility-associated C-terminal domain-containing protein [Phaeodactylibacter sp.]